MNKKIKSELFKIETPLIMGVLNLSPDSFYSKSSFLHINDVENQIVRFIEEDADIIDIGAVSTRSGSKLLNLKDEWERLEPVLELISKKYSSYVFSLDTVYSETAKKAVEHFGIDIINDISAGEIDRNMFETIANLQVPYIIMHMRGKPENMQELTNYGNLLDEIILYFSNKIIELNKLGVNDIIIDPGIGFSKNVNQNFVILNNLKSFSVFNYPILVGLSRKTLIWKTLEITPEDALNGTSVLNTIALLKGAKILRVHDVKQAKEVVKLVGKTVEL